MPLVAVEGDVDTHAELGALIAVNPKTVFINNIAVIVLGDHAAPDVTGAGSNPNGQDEHDTPYASEGSATVFAYNVAIHREDDSRTCGAETYVVNQDTVFADGATGFVSSDGAVAYNNPNGYRAVKVSYQYVNNGGEIATRDELETYATPGLTPRVNTGTPAFDSATTSSTDTTIVDFPTKSVSCNIVQTVPADKFAADNVLSVDKSMKLSKYFTLGNFLLDGNYIPKSLPLTTAGGFRSEVLTIAGVAGKSVITGEEIICNLQALAVNLLDPLMDRFNGGARIPINAAFRLPGRKRAEGQHGLGMAADLQQFAGFDDSMAYTISQWIINNLPFDQLLVEKIGSKPWVHVSYNRNGNRASTVYPNKVGILYPTTNKFVKGLAEPPYVA